MKDEDLIRAQLIENLGLWGEYEEAARSGNLSAGDLAKVEKRKGELQAVIDDLNKQIEAWLKSKGQL